VDDGAIQFMDGQFGIFERVADGPNDLFSLWRRQSYVVRKRIVSRDCGQGCRPDRQIGGTEEVNRATRTVGLDQPVVIPQRVPDGRTCGALNTQRQRHLGCRQDLRVSATNGRRDLSWIGP
jgi:hypothetical protein